jgi:hypothetical protein
MTRIPNKILSVELDTVIAVTATISLTMKHVRVGHHHNFIVTREIMTQIHLYYRYDHLVVVPVLVVEEPCSMPAIAVPGTVLFILHTS